MTLTPLLDAAPHIQIHATAALLALVLGPVALYCKRRDHWHKVIGRLWMGAMLVAVLSSFLILDMGLIGPFSPIHLLSVLALWAMWSALRAIRAGQVARHRATLQGLYWRGVVVAGLFNFLPTGRVVNRMVFPDRPELGYWVIGLGLTALALQALWARYARPAQLRAAQENRSARLTHP
jgi:uncharacterized membrane protein